MSENNSVTNIDEFFKTEHLMGDLANQSVRGGVFVMISQAVKIVSIVILSRLIAPESFGVVAMVTAITRFVVMFKDMGLSMATIQRKKISHKQISTLFWVNVLFSFGMMALVASMAPLIAWFYDEPCLTVITLALASVFFLGGLTVQHQALLRRQMYFGKLAAIESCSILIGLSIAIVSCWYVAGYWSLVLMQIGTAISNTVGVWVVCKWRPGLPVRNSGVRSMLAFGGNITAFNIINYFARNLDKVMIGRFFNSLTLGLYDKAYQIVMIPIVNMRIPLSSVAMPALSRLQNEPVRFRNYYNKLLLLLSLISMPLMVFLFVCSESMIILFLTDKWIDMNNILKILLVAGFIQPVASTRGYILLSLGQGRRYLKWGIFNSIVTILFFVIGIKWGVSGVATSYVIAGYLILLPSLWYCFHSSPVSIRSFFGAIWRSMLASLVMGLAIFFSLSFMIGWLHFIKIIACLAIGLIVYLLMWVVMPGGVERLHELGSYLSLIFSKKEKLETTDQ